MLASEEPMPGPSSRLTFVVKQQAPRYSPSCSCRAYSRGYCYSFNSGLLISAVQLDFRLLPIGSIAAVAVKQPRSSYLDSMDS